LKIFDFAVFLTLKNISCFLINLIVVALNITSITCFANFHETKKISLHLTLSLH